MDSVIVSKAMTGLSDSKMIIWTRESFEEVTGFHSQREIQGFCSTRA